MGGTKKVIIQEDYAYSKEMQFSTIFHNDLSRLSNFYHHWLQVFARY